ncbi:UBC-like protein [Choiromyces venosus 120613-1]|uniref:UBC-like protein n=1 Tax=Choiromyces venosus 120613-1 TaxID=1336337 RepID=A0A3N4J0U7_9PEZI|nr:UBC-like protein [Choiromyces venosus 120613-1]
MSQTFNTKSPTIKRIFREAEELSKNPTEDYHAAPLDENLFEWHFTLRGPPGTPYSEGIYHGRITLPPLYPLRPPSFRFMTPSGRFEVNREICLSISGHHEDTWQPAWGVRTAVVALRGFMETEAKGQVGGVECDEETRRGIARGTGEWRCSGCGGRSNGEILEGCRVLVQEMGGSGKSEEGVVEGIKIGYKDEGGVGDAIATAPEASTPPAAAGASSSTTPQPQTSTTPNSHRPIPTQSNPPPQPEIQTPWLDKLILALIIVLLAHVVKKIASHY